MSNLLESEKTFHFLALIIKVLLFLNEDLGFLNKTRIIIFKTFRFISLALGIEGISIYLLYTWLVKTYLCAKEWISKKKWKLYSKIFTSPNNNKSSVPSEIKNLKDNEVNAKINNNVNLINLYNKIIIMSNDNIL